jgi:hypothetical protein
MTKTGLALEVCYGSRFEMVRKNKHDFFDRLSILKTKYTGPGSYCFNYGVSVWQKRQQQGMCGYEWVFKDHLAEIKIN